MRDVHVHFLHGQGGAYTLEFFEEFIAVAQKKDIDEIYLLEHTHQFYEFKSVYTPVINYNSFQRDWIAQKMNGSIDSYLSFIKSVKGRIYPVKVKFGLEVCYIPETADQLSDCLKQYDFDFLTGSVHWIDGWGFDHAKQKEIWGSVNVNEIYKRYYSIMCELCDSELFSGLAHPDSIKCFGYQSSCDLTDTYCELAHALNRNYMYAENSGGLHLNYNQELQLGLNHALLRILKENKVVLMTASDAHKQSDVGANIKELQWMIDDVS
jgi:histidinol-phosphatase (PHP family)